MEHWIQVFLFFSSISDKTALCHQAQGKKTTAQNDLENSQDFLGFCDHGVPGRIFQEQKYRTDNQDNADNLKRNCHKKTSLFTEDSYRFAARLFRQFIII